MNRLLTRLANGVCPYAIKAAMIMVRSGSVSSILRFIIPPCPPYYGKAKKPSIELWYRYFGTRNKTFRFISESLTRSLYGAFAHLRDVSQQVPRHPWVGLYAWDDGWTPVRRHLASGCRAQSRQMGVV